MKKLQGKNIQERIKEARELKGYTREQLDKALGVSKQSTKRWETTTDKIPFIYVVLISEILGFDLEEFAGREARNNFFHSDVRVMSAVDALQSSIEDTDYYNKGEERYLSRLEFNDIMEIDRIMTVCDTYIEGLRSLDERQAILWQISFQVIAGDKFAAMRYEKFRDLWGKEYTPLETPPYWYTDFINSQAAKKHQA